MSKSVVVVTREKLCITLVLCTLAIVVLYRDAAGRSDLRRAQPSGQSAPPAGILDASKFPSIQAAISSLPRSGGTIFVPSGTRFDPSGLSVDRPVHLSFDCGSFQYQGSSAAIVILASAGSGVRLEGCSASDENSPSHGTAILVSDHAAGGLDVRGSNGFIAENLSFVGPAAGSGVGVRLTGNGAQLYNVQADSFGGDGVRIDGARSNTNNFLLERVKSHHNGGRGFYTFGRDSNVGVWIQTFAQNNAGTQYAFDHTAGHIFVALSAEPQRDVPAMSFAAASENHGSAYLEPASPFNSPAVSFDSASRDNNLVLLNGRKVLDAGTGNRYYLAATDTSPAVRTIENTDTNAEAVLNPIRTLLRAAQTSDQATEGIWSATNDPRSGYMLRENGSINFAFDMNGRGAGVNFLHHVNDASVASAVPVMHLDQNGVSIGGGSSIQAVWKVAATLTFPAIPAHSCREQAMSVNGQSFDRTTASVTVSPAESPGYSDLSWQGMLTSANGAISVRVCNIGEGVAQLKAIRWNATVIE